MPRFPPMGLAVLLFPALLANPAQLHALPAEPAFTLEQVMSAPFVSDLTAAPAGARVAWVANDKGRRNIWVAEVNSHQGSYPSARQITHYTDDDGLEISGLAWSA